MDVYLYQVCKLVNLQKILKIHDALWTLNGSHPISLFKFASAVAVCDNWVKVKFKNRQKRQRNY